MASDPRRGKRCSCYRSGPVLTAGFSNQMTMIKKIVSGGQTGADRAALDFALEQGIPHCGWCPKGRLAEDGPIDARYQLTETSSKSYLQRTERNVRDSDGTVIFAAKLTGGSKRTAELATKHHKPWIHLLAGSDHAAEKLSAFIAEHQIGTLNVAGLPRLQGSYDLRVR
jgi:hypothetical protein